MPKDSTKVDSASCSVNKLVFDTRQCLRLPAVRPLFYPRLPRQPLTNGSRWPPRSATSRLDITELGQPNDVLSNAPFHQAVRSTGQPGKKIMHPPLPQSYTYTPTEPIRSILTLASTFEFVYLFAWDWMDRWPNNILISTACALDWPAIANHPSKSNRRGNTAGDIRL